MSHSLKLAFSLIVVFCSANLHAGAADTQVKETKKSVLSSQIHSAVLRMRDLSVFLRATKQVCDIPAKPKAEVLAKIQAEYAAELSDVKATELTTTETQMFSTLANSCVKDCACVAIEDALATLLSTPKIQSLIEQVQKSAQKMVDQDYLKCQKSLRLNCQSAGIKEVSTALQSSP